MNESGSCYHGTSHEIEHIDRLGTFRDEEIYKKNNITIRDLLIGYIHHAEHNRVDWLNMDKDRCIERAKKRLEKLEGGE